MLPTSLYTSAQTSETVSFPLNNEGAEPLVIPEGEDITLQCTSLSDLTNYTVTWTRNLNPDITFKENMLRVNESGYYCCQVSGPELRESFFCITVLDRSDCKCIDK